MAERLKEWRGFTPNQKVKTLTETKGADYNDVEHTMPPGTEAFVDSIDRYDNDQGVVVTVVIWVDSSRGQAIVNAFDELDGPIEQFVEAV
jgi:DNA-directed RNA polymerase beta subunit